MSNTPLCTSCNIDETVEHFLLHCKKYNSERKILIEKLNKLGISNLTLENILSGFNFKLILEFIESTNRLGSRV